MIFDHYESLKSNPAFSGYTQETKIRRLETFITMVIQEGVAQLKIGDLADSEIKMLDDVDGVAGYLERERVFTEISTAIGQRVECWYKARRTRTDGPVIMNPAGRVLWVRAPEVLMCYRPYVVGISDSAGNPIRDEHRSGDIFIRRTNFSSDLLLRPEGDALFNTCGNDADDPNTAYKSFLHEVGHALGIGGAQEGHSLKDVASVVNYNCDEADCAPHPLDIMALYALYQTRCSAVVICRSRRLYAVGTARVMLLVVVGVSLLLDVMQGCRKSRSSWKGRYLRERKYW